MRIAIQGEAGSFHHQAARLWNPTSTIIPADSFGATFALLKGEADIAVVAVENSLFGSINETLDLIESHRWPVVGEILLHIHQQLIALPGANPHLIRKIYSHPVALAQCEQYLDTHFPNAERIEHHDTAGSVRLVKEQNDPTIAAIAGQAAAALYHLPIIAHDIEDNPANVTRFLVIDPTGTPPVDADKASLAIITDHTPGALARVLTTLADAGINLTKLQSRPIIGEPWQYRFYADIEAKAPHLQAALKSLMPIATITLLGHYKKSPSSQA
jgi:prephenate dehydratase